MATAAMLGVPGSGDGSRPMTSVNAANFNAKTNLLDGASSFATKPLIDTKDVGPEEMAHDMEKQVNTSLEESAFAAKDQNYRDALDKAKQAV